MCGMSLDVLCSSDPCVADTSTSHFRNIKQKIRTLKMSQWEYLACLLSVRSLCASYFFGQRRFGAALHRREEFELEFLGLLWNTYLVIWSIEWPWTGQEYPLDSVIWWNGAWVNCSAASVGTFLWRQTAWSCRQASVHGLEFYRNMCVCVCVLYEYIRYFWKVCIEVINTGLRAWSKTFRWPCIVINSYNKTN